MSADGKGDLTLPASEEGTRAVSEEGVDFDFKARRTTDLDIGAAVPELGEGRIDRRWKDEECLAEGPR